VLARELGAEAEAAAASAPHGNSGNSGKPQRSAAAMGAGVDLPSMPRWTGREATQDMARIEEEEPRPRAAKRGRRGENRGSASTSPPTAIRGGNDNGAGRVLRSRVATPADGPRR
jgi:hypothetical protein